MIVLGTCPDPVQIEAQLAPLVSSTQIVDDIHVEDQGDRYEIRVGGAIKRVSDPARRCEERARVAAVFVALNAPRRTETPLTPTTPAPRQGTAPPARPATEPHPSPSPGPSTPSPRPPSLRWGIEAFFVGAAARSGITGGGGLGTGLAYERFRFRLSMSALWPTALRWDGGEAELLRFDGGLLAGYLVPLFATCDRVGCLRLGPELGVAFEALRLRGINLPRDVASKAEMRVNVGVVGGLLAELRVHERFITFFEGQLQGFPVTYRLRVDPGEPREHTDALWWRLVAGVRFEI